MIGLPVTLGLYLGDPALALAWSIYTEVKFTS